jgi:hypothetical protein
MQHAELGRSEKTIAPFYLIFNSFWVVSTPIADLSAIFFDSLYPSIGFLK